MRGSWIGLLGSGLRQDWQRGAFMGNATEKGSVRLMGCGCRKVGHLCRGLDFCRSGLSANASWELLVGRWAGRGCGVLSWLSGCKCICTRR